MNLSVEVVGRGCPTGLNPTGSHASTMSAPLMLEEWLAASMSSNADLVRHGSELRCKRPNQNERIT